MLNNESLLQAALVGYQNHLAEINQAIADVRKRLGQAKGTPAARKSQGRPKLSAAARQRIADAQKKRWAAYHKKKANKA